MGSWKLANRRPPDGVLLDVDRFESIGAGSPLHARRVSVPTDIDVNKALENAGGLASERTRALEFWWDGPGHRLDVVLVAAMDDMPAYEQDFATMYVNAAFEDSPTKPAWYDRAYYVEEAAFRTEGGDAWRDAVYHNAPGAESDASDAGDAGDAGGKKRRRLHAGLDCIVFDLGYRHGHFMAAFDTKTKHDTITQVSSVMQLAKYGWIQMVFRKKQFTRQFQDLSRSMLSKHKEFAESKHYPASDLLLSDESKPRDHPEKKLDFVTHYQSLQSSLTQKTQDEQVMVSVRGLLETKHEVELDWSGICSVPSVGRSFDHIMMNEYDYAGFVGLQKRRGKMGKRRKPRDRVPEGGRRDDMLIPSAPVSDEEPGDAAQSAAGAELAAMSAAAAIAGRWRPSLTFRIDGKRNRDCTRLRIFEDRLLPDASEIGRPISKYTSKSFLFGRYDTRKSPPFIIMTLPELGLLLRLPDTKATPNLTITRQQAMPQQTQQAKPGFCLGFAERAMSVSCAEGMPDLSSAVEPGEDGPLPELPPPHPMFGAPEYDASAERGVVLAPSDIPTHMYLTGGTKSGKTTLIRCIAKHLEMANLRKTFPNAFIFIDPKGSDSYDLLRQCESASYEACNVTFLDPIETKFSINVLELPPYDGQEARQVLVSQYVGYIMQMLEYWYQGSDAFVRLKRILDTLLQYVYLANDKPTFLDIYEIIVAMQEDGEEMLTRMFKELGMPEDVLKQAIHSVATMESKAYEPALNRLEKFATDPILRHMFCVRESTVRMDELIRPGAYTVIRLSPLNIPQHVITLTKQTLVVKLWFAIQERAERVKLEGERTQVTLALDEFQDLANLPVIEAMLTQARSYGLGLLLAHQSTAQLDDAMFEIIIGNAGTQFVGRVSGRDGGRFGDAWDPNYSDKLKSQLATQEYHHWTARMVAGGGETQPLPIQFWPVFVPPRRQSEESLSEFIAAQKAKYGAGDVGDTMMRSANSKSNQWLLNVPYEPPTKDEWEIMCILKEESEDLMLKNIVARLGDGTTASDTVSGILRRMVDKKLIAITRSRRYILPADVQSKYLDFKPSDIGTSEDIPLSTSRAVKYYLDQRMFLCVATQKVRRGKLRTDLVAYDYDAATPISVEIESYAEMKRHPEHVKLNMTKWGDLGFEECHVWSTHPGIEGVYEGLAEELKKDVLTFVVDADTEAVSIGGKRASEVKKAIRSSGGVVVDDSDDDVDNGADGGQPPPAACSGGTAEHGPASQPAP